MARKLRAHEELAFVRAAPFTELTFGRENCHARRRRRTAHRGQTEKQMTDAMREEFMLDEGLFPEEWF